MLLLLLCPNDDSLGKTYGNKLSMQSTAMAVLVLLLLLAKLKRGRMRKMHIHKLTTVCVSRPLSSAICTIFRICFEIIKFSYAFSLLPAAVTK